MPTPTVARQAARAGAALLPAVARTGSWSSPAARCAAKRRRCCARSPGSRRRRPARWRFWRRGSPSGSARSSGWRARPDSSTARRSDLPIDAEPRADVVVLDTLGELAQLYQVATAVFVGGSLVDHGGHNILEPAIFGKPIVFGPYMQNFKEIADTFLANGAAVQVQSERELEEAHADARRRSGAPRRGSARPRARSSRPTAARRTRRSP